MIFSAKRPYSIRVIIFIFLIVVSSRSTAQEKEKDTVTNYYRYYEFGGSPNFDLYNTSRNGLTVFKMSQDAFTYGIRPYLPKKIGNITGGLWSFSTTFLTMIWTHEIGHSLRARQVGGKFSIHNFAVPFPYTTMALPDSISYQDRALSVTGGFEANYISSTIIQNDFYEYGGLQNDQLSLGFAHRMMYPIYVSLVIPQDPNKKETWINTAGDPVHYIHPVWQAYSNDQVFNSDSTVNSGLVKFYGQSALFSTFWNLLDPLFYKEAAALAGEVEHGKRPWYIVSKENIKWTHGTMFNTSPLGYELFLNNYVKLKERLFVLKLKYGRPFKNNSVAIESPNIIKNDWMKWGGYLEFWDQDIYGTGMMVSSNVNFVLQKKIGLVLQLGYKTNGYSIGRSLEKGFYGWFGIKYILYE